MEEIELEILIMCNQCGAKSCEIDSRVPHFIDRLNGNAEMPDSVYVPARKELWDFMVAKHGKVVKL
jgi:hypothetical protein